MHFRKGLYMFCFDFSPATAWHKVSDYKINSWKYVVLDYAINVHTHDSLQEW